jgi:hypothetical protein
MMRQLLPVSLQEPMNQNREPLPAKQTLLFILVPMLVTFVVLRLYLHLVHVQHLYPGGYLVHHLFLGILILLPATFTLAFAPPQRPLRVLALVAVGIGSAMILDEFVYLVATKATDKDYVSRISLFGAIVSISLATILLLVLYLLNRE